MSYLIIVQYVHHAAGAADGHARVGAPVGAGLAAPQNDECISSCGSSCAPAQRNRKGNVLERQNAAQRVLCPVGMKGQGNSGHMKRSDFGQAYIETHHMAIYHVSQIEKTVGI